MDDGLDGDDDNSDEAVAKVMNKALLNSMMEDEDDGEDSIMANIMNSSEEEASAQFRFLRRLYRRLRRSRLGRFIRRSVRRKVCGK